MRLFASVPRIFLAEARHLVDERRATQGDISRRRRMPHRFTDVKYRKLPYKKSYQAGEDISNSVCVLMRIYVCIFHTYIDITMIWQPSCMSINGAVPLF